MDFNATMINRAYNLVENDSEARHCFRTRSISLLCGHSHGVRGY